MYITNKGKDNQRIHESLIENRKIQNLIKYNNDLVFPNELIKYYRVTQNNTSAFINNYLWAANPSSFNDPFDCAFQLWQEESFSKKNMIRLFNPETHYLWKEDTQYNYILFRDIRIASLGIICLHNFEELSQDILWGYYTEQKGFAIKFHSLGLIGNWGHPFNVEYIDDPSRLSQFNLNDIETWEDLFPRFLRWTTQKKEHWKAENEWRFIFNLKVKTQKMDAPASERMKYYPLSTIKEIILGLKFFDESNSVHFNDDDFYFITDSMKHQEHNQILTYLSEQIIPTFHMFFLNKELKMIPRRCEINKVNDNRFLITYMDN